MPKDWVGRWTAFPPGGYERGRTKELEDELLLYKLKAGEVIRDKRSGRIITEIRSSGSGELVYRSNIVDASTPGGTPYYIEWGVADRELRGGKERL